MATSTRTVVGQRPVSFQVRRVFLGKTVAGHLAPVPLDRAWRFRPLHRDWFLYRISTVLFFLSHTYFFLLDQGRYVNHLYLIALFGFLFIFVPAHRVFSIDAWLIPKLRAQTIPAWGLWLFRIQMAAVYFFAGVAKLTPDWLRGEPMRVWLVQRGDFGVLDRVFHAPWAACAGSYGSLVLDLFLPPLLLWRRTCLAAFCAAVIFHLLNAWMFELDIFPWLAIAATTLFLSPSWPRRILRLRLPPPERHEPAETNADLELGGDLCRDPGNRPVA